MSRRAGLIVALALGCGGGGDTRDAGAAAVAPTTNASFSVTYASGDVRTVVIDAAHPPSAFGDDGAPLGAIYAACTFTLRDAASNALSLDLAVHRDIRLPCGDPEAFDGMLFDASVLTPGMQNGGVSVQVCGGEDYVSARMADCPIAITQSGPSAPFTLTFTGCVLQPISGMGAAVTLDGSVSMSGCETN